MARPDTAGPQPTSTHRRWPLDALRAELSERIDGEVRFDSGSRATRASSLIGPQHWRAWITG